MRLLSDERKTAVQRAGSSHALHLFAATSPEPYRNKRIAFVCFVLVAVLAQIWPAFEVTGHLPPLLGLPGTLWWIAGWLMLMFFAQIALLLSEPEDQDEP